MPGENSSLDNPLFERRRQRNGTYVLRILSATIAALLLVILLLRLPITTDQLQLGWQASSVDRPYTIGEIAENIEPISEREVGSTLVQLRDTAPSDETPEEVSDEVEDPLSAAFEEEDPGEGGQEEASEDRTINLTQLQMRMEPDDRVPRIQGGMGRLYLHINYPHAARQAGIEGLMVMQFVVEEDGTPTNIEVTQPLHPLTDSSAVRALRRVKFVPGRYAGDNVRVRMNLPVRFTLVDDDGLPYNQTGEADGQALSYHPPLEY